MHVLSTNGNCDVFFPFQINQGNQQPQQINFDRLVDMINEELIPEQDENQQSIEMDLNNFLINDDVRLIFDIMFWRGVANPQSGETYDCNDQLYDLL